MHTGFKIAACALPLALMLTGCEGSADIARKPDVIAHVLDGADDCPTLAQYGSKADHHERLAKVLGRVDTVDLDKIVAHGTTICLDKNLSLTQTVSWNHSRLMGVYHRSTNVARMADDGEEMSGLFGSSTPKFASAGIERLAGRFADGNGADAVAGKVGCGKSCTTTRWGDKGGRFSGAESENVGLLRPVAKLEHAAP